MAVPALDLIRFWWTFDAPVTPRAYRIHGVALVLIKYAGDVALVALGAGRLWTPVDYFSAVPMVFTDFRLAPAWLMPALALWTLPFLWAGVSLTLRRAADAGWSPWSAMGFFVPYLNYLLMLALCLLPSASPRVKRPEAGAALGPRQRSTLILSVSAGTVVGLAMVGLAVQFFNQYGLALFFGTPFAMGAITGFVYNRGNPATNIDTLKATFVMFVVASFLLFLAGVEGAVCIVMASPLILALGVLGARFGRLIAHRSGADMTPALFALLVLPAASALEPNHSTGRVLHEVTTSVDISAAPERVWDHVVAFSPITSPPNLLFRLGISQPQSARIDGTGVGAVRYCVFSTGAFVEPITAWEPGRRLAFDVASSPPPLRELSLYRDVSPPHLRGYLRSRRGEFRLVALEGGRTRLEGSTWYEIEMAPEGYWQIFSDYLIHTIHRRVLEHIKDEAEKH